MPEGIEVTEQGYLRIYRVLDVDEGNYRCTAKNSQGSITSKAGFLKVIGTFIRNIRLTSNSFTCYKIIYNIVHLKPPVHH